MEGPESGYRSLRVNIFVSRTINEKIRRESSKHSNMYSDIQYLENGMIIRSLLLTIFASFVTCDVFTAQIELGDYKNVL